MMGLERTLPVRGWLERRAVVLGTAAALLIGVLLGAEAGGRGAADLTVAYSLPVALIALELGAVAGVAAAAAATTLTGLALLSTASTVGAARIVAEALAMVGVGAINGRFSDRMQEARSQQRKH